MLDIFGFSLFSGQCLSCTLVGSGWWCGECLHCLWRRSSVFGVFFLFVFLCWAGSVSLLYSSCVWAFCIIELNLWHFVSVVCCGRMTSCSGIMGEEIISYSHNTDPAVIFVELCVGKGLLKIYSETWSLIPDFLDSDVYFVKDWSLYIFLFWPCN